MPYVRLKGLKEVSHGILEDESKRINHRVSLDNMNTFLPQFGGENLRR